MKALAQGYQRMTGMEDFAFYFVQLAYWGQQQAGPEPVLVSGGWDADTRIQQARQRSNPRKETAKPERSTTNHDPNAYKLSETEYVRAADRRSGRGPSASAKTTSKAGTTGRTRSSGCRAAKSPPKTSSLPREPSLVTLSPT